MVYNLSIEFIHMHSDENGMEYKIQYVNHYKKDEDENQYEFDEYAMMYPLLSQPTDRRTQERRNFDEVVSYWKKWAFEWFGGDMTQRQLRL